MNSILVAILILGVFSISACSPKNSSDSPATTQLHFKTAELDPNSPKACSPETERTVENDLNIIEVAYNEPSHRRRLERGQEACKEMQGLFKDDSCIHSKGYKLELEPHFFRNCDTISIELQNLGPAPAFASLTDSRPLRKLANGFELKVRSLRDFHWLGLGFKGSAYFQDGVIYNSLEQLENSKASCKIEGVKRWELDEEPTGFKFDNAMVIETGATYVISGRDEGRSIELICVPDKPYKVWTVQDLQKILGDVFEVVVTD